MNRNAFLWSDAWLLAAIFAARRAEECTTLAQVIAYGDALNHAIFNPDEIESGLVRLTEGNLIQEQNLEFTPIGAAQAWCEEFSSLEVGGVEAMNWVASKIHAEPYRAGRDVRNNLKYAGFSKTRYDEAINAYHLRGQEIMRSLGLTK